jgi:hypothetical protein
LCRSIFKVGQNLLRALVAAGRVEVPRIEEKLIDLLAFVVTLAEKCREKVGAVRHVVVRKSGCYWPRVVRTFPGDVLGNVQGVFDILAVQI